MNTDGIKNRLKQVIDFQGISIRQFEKSIGASNAYISSIKDDISTKYIRNIMRVYPNISIEWIIAGEGSMLRSGSASNTQISQVANGDSNRQMQHISNADADDVLRLTKRIQELQQQNAKLIDIISSLSK